MIMYRTQFLLPSEEVQHCPGHRYSRERALSQAGRNFIHRLGSGVINLLLQDNSVRSENPQDSSDCSSGFSALCSLRRVHFKRPLVTGLYSSQGQLAGPGHLQQVTGVSKKAHETVGPGPRACRFALAVPCRCAVHVQFRPFNRGYLAGRRLE